jgi:hypothetical protein
MKLMSKIANVCTVILILCQVSTSRGGRPDKEMDDQMAIYYGSQPVKKLSRDTVRAGLEIERRKGDTALPRLVELMSAVKASGEKEDLPPVTQIRDLHAQRTFKARFPENYRYIRAIDYEQKLCDIIDDVIQSLQKHK